MRVIAGTLKGRRLAPVKGHIRPTGSKVREAVFDILGDAVKEARVLDLFAGTGALGIEALSRGAVEAVFVEDSPEALKVLRRNLEDLDLKGRARVLPMPVRQALKKLAVHGADFHLAFLDPPYGGEKAIAALDALAAATILAPAAWVVAEHSRRDQLPEKAGDLERRELRRYGDTQVAFYQAI
ncbi:MAG: 16S rRNA (guanine(966)-N(2))-methyltransferase RsmD [Syntrophales bacterium]|nr:16S rRNA (guanine(966)-N(2))-methyltransferase RsmD [Syntrophales bacterium]MDD5640813.1 16S rRNA (guanine(966)-N(2))-methyltransferase RsmD [Syntrophales bacterium]